VIDKNNKGQLTYDQVLSVVKKLSRGDVKSFVDDVWKALVKSEVVGSCDLYNLLMIFVGTNNVDQEVTEELISEFIQKTDKIVSKDLISTLSSQSKGLFECFSPPNGSPQGKSPNTSGKNSRNYIKEQRMINRLSTKKSPKFTLDIEALKSKEFDECTYHPEIHGIPKKIYSTKEYPKNYKEAVDRIKRVNEEKLRKREAESNEFKEVEVRLQKLRKMKMNPPKCLTRSRTAPKKHTLFYIDIGLSHKK